MMVEHKGQIPVESTVTSYAPLRGRRLTEKDLETYVIKCNLQGIANLRKFGQVPRQIDEEHRVVTENILQSLKSSCPCNSESPCDGGFNFFLTGLCRNLS